jgi:hypothetical protein
VGMKKTDHIEENCKVLRTKRIPNNIVECIYKNEEKAIKEKKDSDKKNKLTKEVKLKKKHTVEEKRKSKHSENGKTT